METKVDRIGRRVISEDGAATTDTYSVREEGREFVIEYVSHPHRGSSLTLVGQDGTLHMRAEDNKVIRQIVALGGGCALAIREEVVEGLSPASLRAVIEAERNEDVKNHDSKGK